VKDASGKKLLTRLEILRGHDWVPVLSYEISDSVSQRRQFSADGNYTSVPIDLPKTAIEELVVNDMRSNWRNYCNEYLESFLNNISLLDELVSERYIGAKSFRICAFTLWERLKTIRVLC